MKIDKIYPKNQTPLFIIENGIGKCVLFSNMIKELSEHFASKISISSPYPDLFKVNPNIASSLHMGLNKDVIKDYFTNIIYTEPYKSDYLKQEEHILTSWRRCLNLEFTEYLDEVEIYVDQKAKNYYQQVVEKIGKKYIIFQLKGGNVVGGTPRKDIMMQRNYIDEYDLVKKVHDTFTDHFLMCIKTDIDEYDNRIDKLDRICTVENEPLLIIQELVNHCSTFFGIDSCVQHMACNKLHAKPGVVLWSTITNPTQIGHTIHYNIQSDIAEYVNVDATLVIEKLQEIVSEKNKSVSHYQKK